MPRLLIRSRKLWKVPFIIKRTDNKNLQLWKQKLHRNYESIGKRPFNFCRMSTSNYGFLDYIVRKSEQLLDDLKKNKKIQGNISLSYCWRIELLKITNEQKGCDIVYVFSLSQVVIMSKSREMRNTKKVAIMVKSCKSSKLRTS